MIPPIYVTFDTNTYSNVAQPKIHRIWKQLFSTNGAKRKAGITRLKWWYLNRCISMGRIVAGIPEPALKLESLPQESRAVYMLSVGRPNSTIAQTPDEKYKIEFRNNIIKEALNAGFAVMRSPRIGYAAISPVSEEYWAKDIFYTQSERQSRESDFIRHFNNYPLDALRDFGEQMSIAHGLALLPEYSTYISDTSMLGISLDRYLWREGIEAEEKEVKYHSSAKAFQTKLRGLLADWADFDIASTHFAYGYNVLCSEDKGGPSSNSIFGPSYAGATTGLFQLQVMNISELSAHCWNRYGFPLKFWN